MHINGSLKIAPTWFSFVAFFLRLGVSAREIIWRHTESRHRFSDACAETVNRESQH